ncbi:MAG: serine/threonine-protein kinase [Gammaproteobacteria bacterium]
MAYDPNLEKHVAIKEYLPVEIAVREGGESVHPVSDDHSSNFEWGLERFIAEARTLSKFKHPNIVHVLSVTEENNTAYMVMEYEEGESLQDILKQRRTIPEAEVMQILLPVLDGLDIVHKTGFIHRDIKPANIYIRKDGSPVLLDFGSARLALGEETKTLTTLVSPGYAPFEQYFSNSNEQGEWTDIYSLGATLYRAVTGISPHEAVDRSNAILKTKSDTLVSAVELGKGNYSLRLLQAIDHALAFNGEDRPQTISAWREEIESGPSATVRLDQVTIKVDPQAETVAGTEARQRLQAQAESSAEKKHSGSWWLLLLLLVCGLFVMMYFVFDKKQSKPQLLPDSTSAVTPAETITEPVTTELVAEPEPEPGPAPDAVKEETVNTTAAKTASAPVDIPEAEPETTAPQPEPVLTTRRLLQDARYHMNAGRLYTPPGLNAYEKYQEVLSREPNNTEAKEGMREIASTLLGDARQAANKRDYDTAEDNLKTLRKLFPDSEPLNNLLKRVKRLIQEREKQDR